MKGWFSWLRRWPVLVGVVLILAIVVGIYLLTVTNERAPQTKKVAQQITMIQPPPPPPPPPPEIKPPEPEVQEEKIEEPLPEQEPEEAPEQADEPPAETLGVDADGSAGADGFGLEGRKGGRSLLGGSGGSAIIWYGGQIKQHLETSMHAILAGTPAMQHGYSIVIDVWVDAEGHINRTELTSGSGKTDVDAAIRAALPKLHVSLGKAPPERMPQPVKIRLTARN